MAAIQTIEQIPYGQVRDTCIFGKHKVNNEEAWEIPWTIVHRDRSKRLLTLFADNIIDLRAFDAIEPSNSDSNRQKYGNNRYRYSNIRKWLNSSAGSWYTAQHSADAPPNTTASVGNAGTQYQSRPGFLYHFSTQERALLGVSSVVVNLASVDGGTTETLEDTVFLPTYKELGGSGGADVGETFEMYVDASNENRIGYMHQNAFDNTLSSSKPSAANQPWYYWLREPYASDSNNVRFVDTDGSLDGNNAYYGYYGVRPCLFIPMQSGVQVLDKMMVLPAASTISYLSPVRTLTGPASTFITVIDLVFEDTQVNVFACNNAYDTNPTWEEITDYVDAKSKFTLTNRTKTADQWGFQVKVTIDKQDAPWMCSRGIAFAVMDDEE